MSKRINHGKVFEEDIRNSALEQGLWFYRIKDISPMMLKPNVRLSKNDYDSFIYKKPNLFPIELKSTKSKSLSLSESMVKKHQIESLKKAADTDGVIPGFLVNFREPKNRVFFININEFLKYKNIAENGLDHTYEGRVNKASIPIHIVEQIGIEVQGEKKRTRYRYKLNKLIQELILDYKCV
ncbi:Holliday junction resolvase RecU [Siminovitchia fordii]|uniref:Holliday junction resolvase RecU n=1 Tax=Siminovitchia fordii TaxID=254759 RepID=A0ABQ4K6R8_9BACI|nr:Holliday junction resolvase RecU [Siminovitchia fordii]GIN21428.1 hypothetical protein J1TS3_25620 [Siminovitchia fordii]